MNRGGFIGKILLAIFVAAIFLTQANPLLSFAAAEERHHIFRRAISRSRGRVDPDHGRRDRLAS